MIKIEGATLAHIKALLGEGNGPKQLSNAEAAEFFETLAEAAKAQSAKAAAQVEESNARVDDILWAALESLDADQVAELATYLITEWVEHHEPAERGNRFTEWLTKTLNVMDENKVIP